MQHHCNLVTWVFLFNLMLKLEHISSTKRCLKWCDVCSTIPWHQVQAPTIFAKHVAKRTWCNLQQLSAIGCYNSSLFEVPNVFGETLAKIVKPLLVQFQVVDKVFIYIKDEHSNSSTFESVTSCKLLKF